MKLPPIWLLALLQLFFAPPVVIPAAAGDDGAVQPALERLRVRELRPGIWIHTSWHRLDDGSVFPGNGLIVQDGNSLVLIDTAWGVANTEALLQWIDDNTGLPVAAAIATHFHADSLGGAPALTARGIPVLGHEATRTLAKDAGVQLPESLGTFDVGETRNIGNVEVFYPGPGHSEDNLVVWIPHAKLLFGSCAVRTPAFAGTGNTADADLANWPVAMQRVLDNYPGVEVVVPGHGPEGDAALLRYTIGLFTE